MLKHLILTGLLIGSTTAVQADSHEGPPPPPPEGVPHAILVPPPGAAPPDSGEEPAGLEAAFDFFFASLDTDGNGEISKEEMIAALHHFHLPHHPGGDHGDHGDMPPEFADLPEPPECSDELQTNEMAPIEENVPCMDSNGNLVFRTVCNVEGRNWQAISLPAGRVAECFKIEAITKNHVVFVIKEEDTGTVHFDTRVNTPAQFHALSLPGDQIYHIELDMAESDPGARVTVAHVDHPE